MANSAIAEAGMQNNAADILDAAGFAGTTPRVHRVLSYERNDEGEVQGYPYALDERVDMIFMDRVLGASIQDLFANPEAFRTQIEAVDSEVFTQTLEKQLSTLHDADLIHQDVTLRNVMLDFATLQPHIIDFGKSQYRPLAEIDPRDELEHARMVAGGIRRLQAQLRGD